MDVAVAVVALVAGAAVALVVTRTSRLPPPDPAVDVRPLLATLHDELSRLHVEVADLAANLSMAQDTREVALLKQVNDLHDRVMVIMSPAFLREYRRQPPTAEERRELIRERARELAGQDRQDRARRKIHYPAGEPDLRPSLGRGIDGVVEDNRRGVPVESFDDLPDDRSSELLPDGPTPEAAMAAAAVASRR